MLNNEEDNVIVIKCENCGYIFIITTQEKIISSKDVIKLVGKKCCNDPFFKKTDDITVLFDLTERKLNDDEEDIAVIQCENCGYIMITTQEQISDKDTEELVEKKCCSNPSFKKTDDITVLLDLTKRKHGKGAVYNFRNLKYS